jgi:hypothetical protein
MESLTFSWQEGDLYLMRKLILCLLFLSSLVLQGCSPSLKTVKQDLPGIGLTREFGCGLYHRVPPALYADPDLIKYYKNTDLIEVRLGNYRAEFKGTKSDSLLRQIENLDAQRKIGGKCREKLINAAKQLADTGTINIDERFQFRKGVRVEVGKKGEIQIPPQDMEASIPDIAVLTVSPLKELNIHCGCGILVRVMHRKDADIIIDFDVLNYSSGASRYDVEPKLRVR